jgi:O-antigen/teichoic acid export membrane protein
MVKLGSKQEKQVFVLYCSSLLGVFLGVLCSSVNTHFLSPKDYGDVRYVENIINLFSSVLLLGYFLTGCRMLALSDSEERSRKIRGVMVIILGITCIILMLLTFICYFFHQSKPFASLFLISLPVCIQPLLTNYINTVAQGDNHINRMALARVLPLAVYVIVAYVLFSQFGATSSNMILLHLGIPTIILLIIIFSTKIDFSNLRTIFYELHKENKKFGFQLYIGSIVMLTTNYLAGLTLGIFNSDNSEVGFYTLALSVSLPLLMLPGIIGTTYYKEFAKLPSIPSKVVKASVALTFISYALYTLIIKQVVVFLYSDNYSVVGDYAILLGLGYSFHGLGDMFNRYLLSQGQGCYIRNSSVTNGIAKIFGFTVFVYFWGTKGAIVTQLICSLIYSLMILYYYLLYTKKNG